MKRPSRLPHWPPLSGARGWFRWRFVPKIVLSLLTAGVLTALVFTHLDIYQVGTGLGQFRADQPAPRDILAPAPLRWVDNAETRRQREEAADQVPMQFSSDVEAIAKAQAGLNRLFILLRTATPTEPEQRELDELKITPEIRLAAVKAKPAAWNVIRTASRDILLDVMSDPLKQSDLAQAMLRVDAQATQRLTDPMNVQIVSDAVGAVLRPTSIPDEEKTLHLKQEARKSIAPFSTPFKTSEPIKRKGEIISAEDLEQLKAKGVLTPAPVGRFMPLAALMLFAILVLGLYLRTFARPVYIRDRKLVLLCSLLATSIWAMVTLGGQNEFLVGLMAVPAVCMAITGLLGMPTGIAAAVVLSLTAGLTAEHQFAIVVLTLGSSLAGMLAVSAIWPASRAVPAVLVLIAVNLLLLMSLEGILPGSSGEFSSLWTEIGRLSLWAGAGGIGATFIAVGAIYMLARPFGITTHYRLMELSNPNEPLLRRMMLEAPGSYHSSVMVANMAEAAADAIGANPLLTRVAALYHDTGKLKRPAFFVENQAPLGIDNIHQRLSPKLSFLILTSHVRDGVDIGRQYRLPEEVLTIIREHHGTTLAAYFYHRAINDAGPGQVAEYEFRYPGPKPSSREAAIVMLADSVQASVKSLKEPTPGRIEGMVTEIINNRLQDGQMEDCDITLRDLRRLGDVFVRMLSGLYTYSRIEYPEIKQEGRARIRANLHTTPAPAPGESTTVAPGRARNA